MFQQLERAGFGCNWSNPEKSEAKARISACTPEFGLFHALIFSLLSQRGYPNRKVGNARHAESDVSVLPVASNTGEFAGGYNLAWET
jgi:hypothetical protein